MQIITSLVPIGTPETEDFLNMSSIVRAYRDDVEFEVDGAIVVEDGATIELSNGTEIYLHAAEADKLFETLYGLQDIQAILLAKINQA